ncbi:MAG: hypothetical protein ACOC78_01115 [Actinomycetota bacterium]
MAEKISCHTTGPMSGACVPGSLPGKVGLTAGGLETMLVIMSKCGGCGRHIDIAGVEAGNKYMCRECLHLQAAGREPSRANGKVVFMVISVSALVMLALAGLAICILYMAGTGDILWFVILLLSTLLVAALPSLVLTKRRNIALLVTSLYLPLCLWSYLWYMAPGVEWVYMESTIWGGLFFLIIGLLSFYLFMRDRKALPRL